MIKKRSCGTVLFKTIFIIILYDEHELKMVLNKTVPQDLFFIISLSGETYQLKEVTQLLENMITNKT
jgi:DNA-binding MurR/RpiR family transcriptional regulator